MPENTDLAVPILFTSLLVTACYFTFELIRSKANYLLILAGLMGVSVLTLLDMTFILLYFLK